MNLTNNRFDPKLQALIESTMSKEEKDKATKAIEMLYPDKINVLNDGIINTDNLEEYLNRQRTPQELFEQEGQYDYEFEKDGKTYTCSLIDPNFGIVSYFNDINYETTLIGVAVFGNETNFVPFPGAGNSLTWEVAKNIATTMMQKNMNSHHISM